MRVALAMLAVCAASTQATTIVAIWTPSKIVISGDSMLNLVWTGDDGMQRHKSTKDCKIRKFGPVYVSAAGNYHIQTAGFDLWETAARSCNSTAKVDACLSIFKSELRRILTPVVGIHDVHLTVLVAGMQDGLPVMEHITLIGTPQGRLDVRTESFRKPRLSMGRVILGDRDAIDRSGQTTLSSDLAGQASSFVKMEAHALPSEVGPPFSTLILDEKGEHWINRGCCPSGCSQ